MAPGEVVPAARRPDEVATVYGWLRRCVPEPRLADDLLVEVVRRLQDPPPDCLGAAPDDVRLRHTTVSVVLRARGVL